MTPAAWRTRLAARPHAVTALLAAPGAAWLLLGFGAPLLATLVASVLARGAYGGVEWRVSTEAWERLADPLYLRILQRTFGFALVTTAVCGAVGVPMAWAVARAGRWRARLLFLVILPFWTSALVRTYAMMFLLRDGGLVNRALLALGLVDAPLPLLYSDTAVLLGLVYAGLPFMVLPVYATLERFDLGLLEAAEVLGAGPWSRARRVILPLALPGIVAGALLVFIPTLGSLLVPDLLGGARSMLAGTLIQNQFGPARDWPFGAALGTVLLAAVVAALLAWQRLGARGTA